MPKKPATSASNLSANKSATKKSTASSSNDTKSKGTRGATSTDKKLPAKKKKRTTKRKQPKPTLKNLKVSAAEGKRFPWETFPYKVVHRDGKDLVDVKTCYFECEEHMNKYLTRYGFKKNEYHMFTNNGISN